MKKLFSVLFIAAVFAACNQPVTKEEVPAVNSDTTMTVVEMVDGQQLEQQLWNDFKAVNIDAIAQKTSDAFQSIHQDGPRDKQQEMELLRNLNLGEVTLTDFKVSQSDNALIVCYMAAVTETIEGKELQKDPTARMSVWVKSGDSWKWFSHSNMNPMK